MTHAEILEQVKEVMEDVFEIDDLKISDATSADDIEEWDSLSHIRLVVALERKFKVKFTNSELEGLLNVGDLVKLVERKKS